MKSANALPDRGEPRRTWRGFTNAAFSRKVWRVLGLAGSLAFLVSSAAFAAAPEEKPIGSAHILKDGTIVLDLYPESKDNALHGIARLTYSPKDRDYALILAHVGPLKPGEEKLVRPFPPEGEKKNVAR